MIKDGITLWTCSDINHNLVKFATDKTTENVPFKELIIVSDQEIPSKITPTKFIKLNRKIHVKEYCEACFNLNDFIETSHVLIYQYDGMAVNKNFWTDEYLSYDYVGSPIHPQQRNVLKFSEPHFDEMKEYYEKTNVNKWLGSGGGGFSLRSKKLLEVLKKEKMYGMPEDLIITVKYRHYLTEKYGIKFAPLDLSMDFCCETLYGYNFCLGFHGWYNCPDFLSEEECLYYIMNLQKDEYGVFRNTQLIHFVLLSLKNNYFKVMNYIENRFQYIDNFKKILKGFTNDQEN